MVAPVTGGYTDLSRVLNRRHFGLLPRSRSFTLDLALREKRIAVTTTSGVPAVQGSESGISVQGTIFIVDIFSTGAMLAHDALERGFRVVRVISVNDEKLLSMVVSGIRR